MVMTTTKRKRGRPSKPSRITFGPAKPAPVQKKPADQGLLTALGGSSAPDPSTASPGVAAPKVERLAPLSATTDAIAADKLGPDLPKKDRPIAPIAPEPLNLAGELLPLLNASAKAARSLWAASDEEVQKAAVIFDRLIEKYLPAIGPYSLEATAAGLMVAYLVPRLMELRSRRLHPELTPEAAGSQKATGLVPADERLAKLG